MTAGNQDGFDDFRRQRRRRQLHDGSHRQMGDHGEVVRQIEAVEAREARQVRLTREVHDFFADATRAAAQIVSQVSESAEREQAAYVAREMSDFLNETLKRAQQFVVLLQSRANPNVAQSEVQANMHNLVGDVLDQFRHAGNSSARDLHIGLDPFAVDVDEASTPSPQTAAPTPKPMPFPIARESNDEEEQRPIENHLVAEIAGDDDAADPVETIVEWFGKLRADEDRVKSALRALVRAQVMSRDTARSIWGGLHATR